MNSHPSLAAPELKPPTIRKADAALPLLIVTGPRAIAIRAGSTVNGQLFADETALPIAPETLEPGADYAVRIQGRAITVEKLLIAPLPDIVGGFHFAPGGNAAARAGGDDIPAINPLSLWDAAFRPACPDPRGMTLVEGRAGTIAGKFWADIYLTGADHLVRGTSAFGVTIADGDDLPSKPGGGRYARFDYETAVAVLAHHGKQALALDEFFAAAFGVTEKTACRRNPKITGLDAPRTSKFGLMQATGNMWVWGHDGDPDQPRASVFGGSWLSDGYAGPF